MLPNAAKCWKNASKFFPDAEKIGRTEEPPVGVSRAALTAGFRYLKIILHNDNYIRSYVEGSIFKLCSLNIYKIYN